MKLQLFILFLGVALVSSKRNATIKNALEGLVGNIDGTAEFLIELVKGGSAGQRPWRPQQPDDDDEVQALVSNLFSNQAQSANPDIAMTLASMIAQPGGCYPVDTPVDIPPHEDPNIIYYPSCTRVSRCSGCCSLGSHECQPTQLGTAVVKVVKARYPFIGAPNFVFEGIVDIELEEHLACGCQCKNRPEHCDPVKHTYDNAACRCVCKNDLSSQCQSPKVWDSYACECTCPKLKHCATNEVFSFSTCRCEDVRDLDSIHSEQLISEAVDACLTHRCRSGFSAVLVGDQCQCTLRSWGDQVQSGANQHVQAIDYPQTTLPTTTRRPRRGRPGRRG